MRRCIAGPSGRDPQGTTDEPAPGLPSRTRTERFLHDGADYGLADALADPAVVEELRSPTRHDEPALPDFERRAYGEHPRRLALPYPGGGSIEFPASGCHGRAVEELYGVPAERYYRAYWAAPRTDRVFDSVVAEPAVERALRAYAGCMSRAGLEADSPAAAPRLLDPAVGRVLSRSLSRAALRAQERRVAAADLDCKQRVGLLRVFTLRMAEEGERQLATSMQALADFAALVETASARTS